MVDRCSRYRVSDVNRRVVVVVVMVAVLGACMPGSSPTDRPGTSTTTGASTGDKQVTTKGVRADVDPVRTYLAGLPAEVEVRWQGGRRGAESSERGGVVGPTDYWIDAVVTLRHSDAERLRSEYPLEARDPLLGLVPEIADLVPAGDQFGSPSLNEALITPGKAGEVRLVGGTLVATVSTM